MSNRVEEAAGTHVEPLSTLSSVNTVKEPSIDAAPFGAPVTTALPSEALVTLSRSLYPNGSATGLSSLSSRE
jgi:hypothetical protein